MVSSILIAINSSFYNPSFISFAAATAWGILSVILSPCHLGAIPLIVGYINEGKKPDRSKAFLYSLLFALGLLIMLAFVGVATSAAGRLLGDIGRGIPIVIGIFLFLCGLWLMEIPLFSKSGISFSVKPRGKGALGALSLGLIYGVILGPCSFAFLAPMLGFVFSAGGSTVVYGIFLMVFYSLGHTAAVVAAGTFGDFISLVMKRKRTEKVSLWFKRMLGGLVALVGVLQILG